MRVTNCIPMISAPPFPRLQPKVCKLTNIRGADRLLKPLSGWQAVLWQPSASACMMKQAAPMMVQVPERKVLTERIGELVRQMQEGGPNTSATRPVFRAAHISLLVMRCFTPIELDVEGKCLPEEYILRIIDRKLDWSVAQLGLSAVQKNFLHVRLIELFTRSA